MRHHAASGTNRSWRHLKGCQIRPCLGSECARLCYVTRAHAGAGDATIAPTPAALVASHAAAKPRLAVTLGDPAGIGPEVVLKSLAAVDASNVTVVGSGELLERAYQQLRRAAPSIPLAHPEQLRLLDVTLPPQLLDGIAPGQGSSASGEASFRFLQEAAARTLAGEFDGIVTAPIAKSLWHAAGHLYPGQTEALAAAAGAGACGMLFVATSPHTGWQLRALLATTHIPLRDVPTALTAELMDAKLDVLLASLRDDFGVAAPRVVVSGLNPHSGEGGQLGSEEVEWLSPWLQRRDEALQAKGGGQLEGPVPPDTMWVTPGRAWYGGGQGAGAAGDASVAGAADAYLALYHDQGLIPVKLLAFDRAVNTTIGLPFVRTSPDHGTAFGIAGRGIADADSMRAAIGVAAGMVGRRKQVSAGRATART